MNPEDFTIKEIREFQESIKGLTIYTWKIRVKEFGTAYGLTDRQAIELANCKLPEFSS